MKVSGSPDPYKILGLQPGASPEEIRQAYRRVATKYHPDTGGDAWVFQQVQQAYEELRAQHQRAQHAQAQRARANSATASESTKSPPPSSAQVPGAQAYYTGQAATAARADHRQTNPRSTTQGAQHTTLWDWLFGKPLSLHNETSYFIFANFMDLVMTLILLRYSAVEANPIANYFYQRYGFVGMIGLKIASVSLVCIVAQSIASRSRSKARWLLIGGTILVATVVVYSIFLARSLLPNHYG